MESVAGAPVVGEDLFGRERELAHIWRMQEHSAHVLMTAQGGPARPVYEGVRAQPLRRLDRSD